MRTFDQSRQPNGNSENDPRNEHLYKAVKSQTRFEKLHKRFSNQDFAAENERWRVVALVASYTINLLSISGAWYGAFSLFQWFGAEKYVSGSLAIVLLALVEIARRFAADGIWDKWFHLGKVAFAMLALNIALFVASSFSSGYGIYQGITDNAALPPALSDSILQKMEMEAAAIRGDIETSKRTKWRGTVTVDAQRTIKSSSKALATLTDAITARRAALSAKQDATDMKHKLTVRQVGLIAVLVYLFLEFVFQICIRFISLYDYREFLARVEQGQKSLATPSQRAAVSIDPALLAQVMANVKTGGMYPLNFVNPHFQAFMQHGANGRAQNGQFETLLHQLPIDSKGEMEQPQKEGAIPTQIVEVPTDIVIEHIDRLTGKKKRLNITQVRRNLSANLSRLKKASSQEQAANIRQQVEYWKAKENELIKKYNALELARKG